MTVAKETKNNSFEFSGEKIILEEKLNLDNVSTISTKQLAEVNGIGIKTVEKLKDKITIK